MQVNMPLGNANLISSDEEIMAAFLKERNLGKVNAADKEVYIVDSVYTRYMKRILDLLIAVPACVVTFPLNVVFGICTFFDVGRPIFYKQTRLGKDGQPFVMIKFRNMNENKDADGKLLPASERVTKFGKFMRRYSLDELLNFWSVLKGDMSIIGPRPLPAFFSDRMSERHKKRHCVRPGLECPYTIPECSTASAYHWKFENDVWYVENVSFKTDIKMLLELFRLVFNMKSRGGHASGLSYFVGYDDDGHATALKRVQNQHPGIMEKIKNNPETVDWI